MNKHFRVIIDIFLSRAESCGEALKLEWEYHAQNARIWRQYKGVTSYDDEATHAQAAEQLNHISVEEQFLAVIETRKLLRAARKYGIEMPDTATSGDYEAIEWDVDHSEPRYLTAQGMASIRRKLRQAQKERREAAGFWFGIVVGLIGAVTGLLAVMR